MAIFFYVDDHHMLTLIGRLRVDISIFLIGRDSQCEGRSGLRVLPNESRAKRKRVSLAVRSFIDSSLVEKKFETFS